MAYWKKNRFVQKDGYVEIYLKNRAGEEVAHTKVSNDQFEKVRQWRWCRNSCGYAICNKCPLVQIHRLIIGKKEGFVTDHINGDRLDNRNENLRHLTLSQNGINTTKRAGVSYYKLLKKWGAYISVNKKSQMLGYFDTKEEAQKVRREAEIKYYPQVKLMTLKM